jgi:hypothetical protein
MNNVAKLLGDCVKNGSDTVIIPMNLKTNNSGHANVLIYRKSENVIERFEPHGNEFRGMSGKKTDDYVTNKIVEFCAIVNKAFDKHNIPHIRFKSASEVCPSIHGIQSLEDVYKNKSRVRSENEGGGYCQIWSMFFVELVLNNPTVPSDKLLDLVLTQVKGKKGHEYLVKIAKGYAYHVSSKLEKYFSILFDEKDLYSKLIQKKDTATSQNFIKKFSKHLFYLGKIEMAANMNPNFNPELTVKYIIERLNFLKEKYKNIQLDKAVKELTNMQKIDEENYRKNIESLETQLTVYQRLGAGALKDMSPERVYQSPKKKEPKSKKSGIVAKPTTKNTTKRIKKVLGVIEKKDVVLVE